jgi:hypothetical protein
MEKSWEKFEEQAKIAFVGDPHGTRFFLKTTHKSGKAVTRVSQNKQVKSIKKNVEIQYETKDSKNILRISRLLRFFIQEILGPMKTNLPNVLSSPSIPSNSFIQATQGATQAKTTTKKKKGKK